MWLSERLAEYSRGLVLDVGCGEGRFLPTAGIGIDRDLGRLRAAGGRRVAAADALRLPFADATFDTAYAIRMLNDTGDVDAALSEIRRILRAGGRLLVYTRARSAEGDRLDASNGEARLRAHFPSVDVLPDPEHDGGALFVASR
ncbi:MAG TPA: class I SAM-dependent methyltransferase [Candidatus Limnocylindria bacterium]|nr:class I SAM-dependent methyltransferase [Candidatus Limnocylindria bacterium]